jgi:hypothetical protein
MQVLPAASFHMGANFRPDAIDRRHFFSNPTQRWRQREIIFLFYTNPANPVKHICKKYVYIYIYIHTYSYNHSFYLDYNLSWFILFFYLLLGWYIYYTSNIIFLNTLVYFEAQGGQVGESTTEGRLNQWSVGKNQWAANQ